MIASTTTVMAAETRTCLIMVRAASAAPSKSSARQIQRAQLTDGDGTLLPSGGRYSGGRARRARRFCRHRRKAYQSARPLWYHLNITLVVRHAQRGMPQRGQ
jgi:hypothetical protein